MTPSVGDLPMNLRVEKLPAEDAWKDIVRIPEVLRKDCTGKHVKRGSICRIIVDDKSKWVIVHGLRSDDRVIQMDLNVRIALGVEKEAHYDVEIEQLGWLQRLWFPWKASDPLYRLPAQLSIIAFILGMIVGVLGLLVGLIPMYEEHQRAAIHQSTTLPASRDTTPSVQNIPGEKSPK